MPKQTDAQKLASSFQWMRVNVNNASRVLGVMDTCAREVVPYFSTQQMYALRTVRQALLALDAIMDYKVVRHNFDKKREQEENINAEAT